MKINGEAMRTIWLNANGWAVDIIDQTLLPHQLDIKTLETVDDAALAISDMWVRGAPLIGATAAYGLCLALREDVSDTHLFAARDQLQATRPTAINLKWALDTMLETLLPVRADQRLQAAYAQAGVIAEDDVICNRQIGFHGLEIIRKIYQEKGESGPVNILTHCNAGWLATVDHGTATSPIYMAHDDGIPVHVWVDETRPRNQGAHLTAWELGAHGVPHSLIVDNAGGHIMQHGKVDLCITGTDRTTRTGDVCNKIGTYLKALAACDNAIPFYVALPSSTIDWTISDGLKEVPIEMRSPEEVTHITGLGEDGRVVDVLITPENTVAANYAFDVTPARLITGLITENGVCEASEDGLTSLFPQKG